VEPEESRLTPCAAWTFGALGEPEVRRDADPDDDERSQHPEQESRLADRKPRKLLALEEEPNPMAAATMNVEFDDLAAHSFGGIVGRTSGSVAVDNGSARRRASHLPSVALGVVPACGRPERSPT
jgi:hypothetical protein